MYDLKCTKCKSDLVCMGGRSAHPSNWYCKVCEDGEPSLRERLFHGWRGCSNHGCIVTGPKSGMATNGSCRCVVDASRAQLQILQGRIAAEIARQSKEGKDNV